MIHKYNNLGWECSPVTTSGSSSWSNQQHEIGDSGYGTTGGKMELPVDIFNLIQPLHKSTIEPISHHDVNYSNFEKISQMFQHVAQRVDSINLATNFNFSQYQEAIKRAHDMIMGQGYPLSTGQMADFGTMPAVDHHTPYVNGKPAVSSTTASFESLDCLLSATNSNTDTSVENDDGINSMIFTDGKKLWNFGSISSGDSAGNNKKQISRIHEVDEAVSCSSQLKHNSKKIISVQSKLFRGDFSDNPPKLKKPRLLENKRTSSSSNINFQQPSNSTAFSTCVDEPDSEAIAQMKEMIYRAAAFRPVNLGEEFAVEKPRRKNVRISSDPQTVAARQRREKISEKIRLLQRLVPGGSKMDTASMLDEAANYLKFLRSQVKALETIGGHKLDFVNCQNNPFPPNSVFPLMINHSSSFPMQTTHFNSPFQNPNPVHHPNS